MRRLILAALFLLLIAGLFSNLGRVHADKLDEIYARKSKKEKQLKQVLADIKKISGSRASVYQKISKLEGKVKEAEKLAKDLKLNLQKLSKQYEAEQRKLDEIKKKLAIRSTYLYLDTQRDFVLYLLDSDSLGEFIDRMTLYSVYYQTYLRQLEQIRAKQQKISAQIDAIKKQLSDIDSTIFAVKKELKDLYAQRAMLNAQLRARYSARAQLVHEIVALSAQARRIIEEKASHYGSSSGGGNSSGGGGVVPPSGSPGDFVLRDGSGKKIAELHGPVRVIMQGGGYFKVKPAYRRDHYKYRGVLELRKDTNVYVINELPLETYLYGIGEMQSWFNSEALKAQAVVSRSFAWASFGKMRRYHYDVYDNVYDQNYVGVDKEFQSAWKSAVDATAGQVLKMDGKVIRAYFHSTCGGHTLSSQEVWGGYRKFAQAKSDRYLSGGVWKGYDDGSPYARRVNGDKPITYAWLVDLIDATIYVKSKGVASWAVDQVACLASNRCYGNLSRFGFGKIKNILGNSSIEKKVGHITNIVQIYNDGRTTTGKDSKYTKILKIIGDKGTYTLDARVFKLVYNVRSPGRDYIGSSLYDVVKASENDWKFYTRGLGHRVGMCQWGAQGRAKAGQSYVAILKYYYNNPSIGKVPNRTIRVGLTKAGGPVTTIIGTGTFKVVDKSGHTFTFAANTKINIERR